jgi:GNAT superfamily N-acetyltransferase
MKENIEFKELLFDDINDGLLDNFNRYQEVKKYWQKNNDSWALVDKGYIFDWDKNKKDNIVKYFSNIITEKTGCIFGADESRNLIGFSVLLNKRFGTKGQYIEIKYLHVSLVYRHKGIGKRLFELCIKRAKTIGSIKVYISANDSEDTIKFYL